MTSGVPGEAARYASDVADLRVARAGGVPLATADTYADSASIVERQGLENGFRERSVVRINGVIAVDDRYAGTYAGRRVLYRQFTVVPRTQGLALIFHYVPISSVEVSHWYHPLLNFRGEVVAMVDATGGGPCGEMQAAVKGPH